MRKMLVKSLVVAVVIPVALPSFAQTNSVPEKVVWRAHLGGGSAVNVDTITSLPDLIKRLAGDWRFIETFKGYWIGYTDDMYSIASHGEAAIAPLLHFIQATPAIKSRYGALYCLHLIGINSKVVGRYHEQFQSLAVRQALRTLLGQDDLRELVIELLIRDPWQSDVPYLFAALEKSGEDDWALVNSLIRYQMDGLPIQQPIPPDIGTEIIKVPTRKKRIDYEQAANLQVQQLVGQIRQLQPVYITLEDSVAQGLLLGATSSSFEKKLSIREFLYNMIEVDYLTIGSRLHYFVDKNGLTICTTQTARKRLLMWWHAQKPEFRQQFMANAAKKRTR